MLEAAFKYMIQDKLYIWKNPKTKMPATAMGAGKITELRNNSYGNTGEMKLSGDKLRDLAWSLDVLDLNKGGREIGQGKNKPE